MADDLLIAEIEKNSREIIRIQVREFRGKKFVDIRIFVPGPDGELRATGKGVAIKPDLVGRVVDAPLSARMTLVGHQDQGDGATLQ